MASVSNGSPPQAQILNSSASAKNASPEATSATPQATVSPKPLLKIAMHGGNTTILNGNGPAANVRLTNRPGAGPQTTESRQTLMTRPRTMIARSTFTAEQLTYCRYLVSTDAQNPESEERANLAIATLAAIDQAVAADQYVMPIVADTVDDDAAPVMPMINIRMP